jgi:hypothetical protein
MGNWTSYPTHTKLNGNLYERFNTQGHVINIIDDNTDANTNSHINIVDEFNRLKHELYISNEKRNQLEVRLAKIESVIHSKLQTLDLSINNTNSRISVITTDLESLLNNDKLLLDKLIEKNIVSTIQEEEEYKKEDTQEYPSGIEQYLSLDTNPTPLDEVNL